MTVTLLPAEDAHFACLLAGDQPEPHITLSGTPIADPEVLAMLAGLAATIAKEFRPAAWMIVAERELVGLLSLTAVRDGGALQIGYGVAPGSQGRGHASAAVAALLEWARGDDRVQEVIAETRTDNIASQRVLERNGFFATGERLDEEDGLLFCWRAEV